MRLSIIIPAWILDEEKEKFLRECVKSIRDYTDTEYELIIIDNGSKFAREFMRSEADICIANRENKGFAPAVNQGFKLCSGDYVAVMNDDITVGPEWASRLIRSASMGCVTMPDVILKEHLIENEPKGETIRRVQEEERPKRPFDYETFCELDGWGSLFVARKDVFQKAVDSKGNLMSEDYRFTMWDDRDLWLRLCKKGIRNVRDHRVWVFHVGNGTWGKIPDGDRIFNENREIFEKKRDAWYAERKCASS